MNHLSCPECGSSLNHAHDGLCAACLFQNAAHPGDPPSSEAGAEPVDVTFEATRSFIPENIKHPVDLPADSQFGDYLIRRRLGRGGMGTVYEAKHLSSGRHVALKVLSHAIGNRATKARFLREGRLAASVNHVNSVYVFGTEEIDGKPAISMELVRGGTLEQRVRDQGPLSVGEAVDLTLQIIEGLEAAESKGVLHRDIKPANCFVSPDGTVKVGDFGLSVSTNSTDELPTTQITHAGSFLGTPAFASPEQLRGELLDTRSDIYSVGVTLFYLLTGKVPFEGKNLIQLLAKVLDRPAGNVRELNSSVPVELSKAIAKCLEKSAGNRFVDYQRLKQAIAPFSSAKPVPAMLGQRFLAGLVDHALLVVAAALVSIAVLGTPGIAHDIRFIPLNFAVSIGYFTVMESLFGYSLGKLLFRLRVTQNGITPSWLSNLARASIYILVPAIPTCGLAITYTYFSSLLWVTNYLPPLIFNTFAYSHLWIIGLLFITARRSNGNASFHDLITNTSVQRVKQPSRTTRQEQRHEDFEPSDQLSQIGEYYLLKNLSDDQDQGCMWLGYDAKLLRRVWIQTYSETIPELPITERQMARPTRLRWLGSRRGAENWDCFEAPAGSLFAEVVAKERNWSVVERSLIQLVDELELAQQEGSLPAVLAFDQVWLDANGQIKLLPMHWQATELASQCRRKVDPTEPADSCKRFVADVTKFCIEQCRLAPRSRSQRECATGVPIRALELPAQLIEAASLKEVSRTLASQTSKVVNRNRRLGLALATFGIAFLLFFSSAFSGIVTQTIVSSRPEFNELKRLLVLYENLDWYSNTPGMFEIVTDQKNAVETVMAGKFRSTVTDPSTWNSAARRIVLTPKEVALAETLADSSAKPSNRDVEIAEEVLNDSEIPIHVAKVVYFDWSFNLLFSCNFWLQYIWLPSLITALLFGGGLIVRAFELAFADRHNLPASRLRVFLRMLIPGIPFLLTVAYCFAIFGGDMGRLAIGFSICSVLALIILTVGIFRGRFLSDWLAGTYLVPR